MTKTKIYALTTVAFAIAFDSGKAGWKMDGDKIAIDGSGNPIYVREDGGEQAVEGGTISRLNGEAKMHREAKEAAETKLRAFEGLDPVKAKEAITKLGEIDLSKMIERGELDKVKAELSAQYTAQLTEAQTTNSGLQDRINNMTLSTAFAKSEFIKDRLAIPAELFENTFTKNFKVEDGKVVPYDSTGSKVFSKKRMGELADLDEALEIIVEAYPHKDTILRAPDAGGSGNGGNGGNRGGKGRVINRADFAGMTPADQAATAAKARTGEVTITD